MWCRCHVQALSPGVCVNLHPWRGGETVWLPAVWLSPHTQGCQGMTQALIIDGDIFNPPCEIRDKLILFLQGPSAMHIFFWFRLAASEGAMNFSLFQKWSPTIPYPSWFVPPSPSFLCLFLSLLKSFMSVVIPLSHTLRFSRVCFVLPVSFTHPDTITFSQLCFFYIMASHWLWFTPAAHC